MPRIFSALCTLLLIIVFAPSSTRADPIVITGGGLWVLSCASRPGYLLYGNNFSIDGVAMSGQVGARSACSSTPSGSVINLSTNIAGFNMANTQNLSFSLSAPSITLPDTLTSLTITRPFVFSGTVTGCITADCGGGPDVPTFTLVGGGTVRLNLMFVGVDSRGVPFFRFQDITYRFEVPEPASILLLGGGLAALGARLRRKWRSPQ